jgi:lipopolysaccharide export system permease LptF/LptG-like protein
MTRPGLRLRAFAARFCSTPTMNRLIDPTIADLQREHADARQRGAMWTARWVRSRGCVSVAALLAYTAAGNAFHAITQRSGGESSYLKRFSVVFLVATIVTTMLIAYPQAHHRDWEIQVDGTRLTIYLIPSILPLSTAWAVVLAIVCSGRERLTRKLTAAVLATAFACSIAMFANLAWLVPESNQAFRKVVRNALVSRGELVFRQPLARGDNEMSMSELRRQIALQPGRARQLTFTYHSRWSLAFAPLVLAGLAVLLVRSIKRTAIRAMVACALCAGHWVALLSSRAAMTGGYPVPLAAWLPNLILVDFCLVAAAVAAWRSKTSLLRALTDSG